MFKLFQSIYTNYSPTDIDVHCNICFVCESLDNLHIVIFPAYTCFHINSFIEAILNIGYEVLKDESNIVLHSSSALWITICFIKKPLIFMDFRVILLHHHRKVDTMASSSICAFQKHSQCLPRSWCPRIWLNWCSITTFFVPSSEMFGIVTRLIIKVGK